MEWIVVAIYSLLSLGAFVHMFRKVRAEDESVALGIIVGLVNVIAWPFLWSIWGFEKIQDWLRSDK